jgi:hypothetical protein
VRILQTVVGAGTCLLVWLLVRRLYGEVAGIAAAWIAAIYPFLIFYCGELLSEAFFIPAFLGAVLLLDMADGNGIGRRDTPLWRRRLAAAVSAGLVLGIATLIRSSSLLFLLFYLPFWLLKGAGKGALASQAGQQTPVRQRHASAVLRVLALFALAVLAQSLTLLPWTTRNYRKFHAFVPTTLQTGESLYEANSPYATGGPAWHLVDWKKESDGRQMEELENDQFWRRKALEWIRTHPGDFLRLAAVKLGRFWSPVPNYKGMRTPFYVTVSLLSYGPVMLLALYGLALSISRWRRLLVLVAPILYYTALHAVYVGSIRYRTPVMPFVMAFSGWAVALLLTRALRARRALILPGGQG